MKTKFTLSVVALFLWAAHLSAQALFPYPSPSNYAFPNKGYTGEGIEFDNQLFLRYQKFNSNYNLFKFDGSTLTEIPSPPGYDVNNFGLQRGMIAYGGKLWLRYGDGMNQQALFTYDGNNLTLMMPPGSYTGNFNGYRGNPFIYGNILYLGFRNSKSNSLLITWDGTSFDSIPSPPGYDGAGSGYGGFPIEYQGDLYMLYRGNDGNQDLFRWDGTTLDSIPSPAGYDQGGFKGYDGYPFVYNGNLYLGYEGNNNKFDLFRYDGTTLDSIPSPADFNDPFAGYIASNGMVEWNGKVYLFYNGNDNNNDVAEFDGTNLNIINSPPFYTAAGKGYRGGIVYNNELFLRYGNNSNQSKLFKYDGSMLIEYPHVPGYIGASNQTWGHFGGEFLSPTHLYIAYRTPNGRSDIVKFDGTNFKPVQNPVGYDTAGVGYYYRNTLEYQGDYYVRFLHKDGHYDLMKMVECTDQASTISVDACNDYLSPSGRFVWTASGTYQDTIGTVGGCDSIMTVNLTILPVDTSVTANANTLTSNQAGASYQWLDCANNNAPIPGATGQTYVAPMIGLYAVAVTTPDCSDTSACQVVLMVNADQPLPQNTAQVYPNPTDGAVHVRFERSVDFEVEVYDGFGRLVLQRAQLDAVADQFELDAPAGIYFVRIRTADSEKVVKLLHN